MANSLIHHALLTGQIDTMEYYKLMMVAESSRPTCFVYHDKNKNTNIKPDTKGYSIANRHRRNF